MKKLVTSLLVASMLVLPGFAAEEEEVYYEDDAGYYEEDAGYYEEDAGYYEEDAGSGYVEDYVTEEDQLATDEFVIPNSPILRPTNIITIRAIGMGVAPETTISPAQALVLAKRAAIADSYRQLGEKMYGIRINAKDTIKDAVVKSSSVRTQVNAIIRNAEIQETVYKDGLCQVEMEVKLDGRRWYRVLSGY